MNLISNKNCFIFSKQIFSQNLLPTLNSRKIFQTKQVFTKNYYQILGVNEKSDKKAIRSAYLKLCKQYHPDMNRHINDRKAIETNKIRFQEISRAYNCLIKDRERSIYDQNLRSGNSRSSAYQQPHPYYRQSYQRSANFNDYYYYNFGKNPFEYNSRYGRQTRQQSNTRDVVLIFHLAILLSFLWIYVMIMATLLESFFKIFDNNDKKLREKWKQKHMNDIKHIEKDIENHMKNTTTEQRIEEFLKSVKK